MVKLAEHRVYRVGELAEATGVTRRTVHYYVGRGLLPPPEGMGLGTTYSDEHYYRIMLIKQMQQAYLPLDEIRSRLAGMRLPEVKACVEEGMSFAVQEAEERHTAQPLHPGAVAYERIALGRGVELHFPAEGSTRTKELVERILEYVQSISKEV